MRCLTCDTSPDHAFVSEINILALHITDTNKIELALASFFSTEKVLRKCLVCNRNEITDKEHVFSEIPLFATIQLRRFDNHAKKIRKHVQFSKYLVLQSHDFATGDNVSLEFILHFHTFF